MTTPDPTVVDVPIVAVDRPADDPMAVIAALQKQVDDLSSTLQARVSRGRTGTIEPSLLLAAPTDALFMTGQSLLRSTYPVLWQWVQDQGLTAGGGFTAGDGSTTFTLPNMSGRVLVGVGTLGAHSYALGSLDGSSSWTLDLTNLPAHNHNVTVSDHGSHNHNITTNNQGGHWHGIGGDGNHTGHQPSGFGGAGGGAALVQQNDTTNGYHSHGGGTGSVGDHGHGGSADLQLVSSHGVSQSNVGNSAPIDLRQPSFAVNWIIWT